MEMTQDSPLITMAELASLLRCGYSTVSRMRSAGLLPNSVGKRHRPRWARAEVLTWIAAGCPDRATWEASKAKASRRK